MDSALSSRPPAGNPPVASVTSAAARPADHWDWLRVGVFFWGAVYLLTLIPTILFQYDYSLFLTNQVSPSGTIQTNETFFVVDLLAAPALLILLCALSDRRFWGTTARSRGFAAGRLALALVAIGAFVAFVFLVLNDRLVSALTPPSLVPPTDTGSYFFKLDGVTWLITGAESGLLLGIALAFVFRRLSSRTGRPWLVGLIAAMLVAAVALALQNQLSWLLLSSASALQGISIGPNFCSGGLIGGCFGPLVLVWLGTAVVPVLVALPLGALLVGAPLAYPYGGAHARQAPTTADGNTGASATAPAGTAHPRGAGWRVAIGAGSFAAGLFVAASQYYRVRAPAEEVAITLAPFILLALSGAIVALRSSQTRRPSTGRVIVLALVVVLGLIPVLALAFLSFLSAPFAILPMYAPGMLYTNDSAFSLTLSLGLLLALLWAPMRGRSNVGVTLTAWLGFSLFFWGSQAYSILFGGFAIQCMGTGACHADFVGLLVLFALVPTVESLPLLLAGVWMGSWLLRQRSGQAPTPAQG